MQVSTTSQTTPFKPDQFQIDAVNAFDHGNVIVSAPTGSGKTWIAIEAIKKSMQHGVCIYTTPIKALSNEKCKQLTRILGMDVGIVTGDIKYNVDSNVLIMTTEIYNDLVLNHRIMDEDLEVIRTIIPTQISLVVFDEAHYITDPGRGGVWEESIMNTPPCARMLLLSATIERPDFLRDWIGRIHGCTTLVSHAERAVPLEHMLLYVAKKNSDLRLFEKGIELRNCNKFISFHGDKFEPHGRPEIGVYREMFHNPGVVKTGEGLIRFCVGKMDRMNMLPAIFFVFSRKKCEEYAMMCTTVHEDGGASVRALESLEYLVGKAENGDEIKKSTDYKSLKHCVERGIAWHNAGLHPVLKESVEMLFGSGHVKILFATETFSVGVNYPARSVVFTSLKKFDGARNRYLMKHEYMQMSGRAGRRGFDNKGYVIILPSMFTEYQRKDNMGMELSNLRAVIDGNGLSMISKYNLGIETTLKAYKFCPNAKKEDVIYNIFTRSFGKEWMTTSCVIDLDADLGRILSVMSTPAKSKTKQIARQKTVDRLMRDDNLKKKYEAYKKSKTSADDKDDTHECIKKMIDYVSEIGLIEDDVITLRGLANLEFANTNSIVLVEWIESDKLNDWDDASLIGIVGMIVEQTEYDSNFLAGDIAVLFAPVIDDLDAHRRKDVSGGEWGFTLLPYVIASELIAGNSLDMIKDSVGTSIGEIYRVLIRTRNLLLDASKASTVLGKHEMALRFKTCSKLLGNKELMLDSLYVRGIECA